MNKLNTIIVPTLNNYSGLLRLLITLKKHTPNNYNVIVINNGHSLEHLTDEQIDAREDAKKMVQLWIDPYRNLGFSKAMNLGLKLAQTEFVTIANDDVEIIYDAWWDELMALFEADEHLGGWNPHSPCNKRHTGDRVIQYEYNEDYATADIEAMKAIFKGEREYVGCCTYFTICRKAMFDDIGLFDESFLLGSGEDYDYCVRAARGGWLIKGGSRVMVWHWWGNTKDNMPKEKDFISNYDLIAGGNQNLTAKWGPHCDEVQRQLKDGKMTEEQAKELEGGWSVSGRGGYKEPVNQNEKNYKVKGKWFVEVDL